MASMTPWANQKAIQNEAQPITIVFGRTHKNGSKAVRRFPVQISIFAKAQHAKDTMSPSWKFAVLI